MVTITVKDQDTDQEMNITITGPAENANVDIKFNPPVEGEIYNMWGTIAKIVVKAIADA